MYLNRLDAAKLKAKKAKSQYNSLQERTKQLTEEPTYIKNQQAIAQKQRHADEDVGQQRGVEFFNKPIQGYTPEHRAALQNQANAHINSTMHTASKKLLGDQASRGILGQGGVKYAQQRDLMRQGMKARGDAHNEVAKQDAERAIQKQAQVFAAGAGEASQANLERQEAKNDLRYTQERQDNKKMVKKFGKNLSRL